MKKEFIELAYIFLTANSMSDALTVFLPACLANLTASSDTDMEKPGFF